ncbi:MAG: hypothetical protein LUB61_02610 [Eggerthellaceae bacterium]|nr:hypothetical protein [Eggerthellaceae bacterium]
MNSNIFELQAQSVMDAYGSYLDADPNLTMLIVCSNSLAPVAKDALASSAERLGYGRNAIGICMLTDGSGHDLNPDELMTIVEGLDPIAVVATDREAAELLGKAYRLKLATDDINRAMGRSVVAFYDFEKMMNSSPSKQKAWALLKRIDLR